MVIMVRNPIARLVLILIPLIIFAVVYFTVIKPSTDNANDVIRDADKQIRNTPALTQPSGNPALDKAQKAQQCVANAGTDTSKLQACAAAYGS